MRRLLCTLLLALAAPAAAQGPLPPVPVPAGNPVTEPKRVLGKILFWDEQLSSDQTVACGSCHRPRHGGVDPRPGLHPGADGTAPGPDDVLGSRGVRRRDAGGQPVHVDYFGHGVQVTRRASPSFLASQYAPLQFWDGRSGDALVDPITGAVVLPSGASLEAQALEPFLDPVEMAREGRDWADVEARLGQVAPLALASDWPDDVAAAIGQDPSYPELFAAAFGDPGVDPVRIAMALASYERTLVADQAPIDAFNAGDFGALTPDQLSGRSTFINGGCADCHAGPTFSDHSFRNIGLRPSAEDPGRQGITGNAFQAGRFKVPSLRNVGLRSRFMHHGQLASLQEVVDFYRGVGAPQFGADQDPAIGALDIPASQVQKLIDFLANALLDPRVAAGQFPFDRPTLASEQAVGVAMPVGVQLLDPWPNPTAGTGRWAFRLDRPARARVEVLDLRGRTVRTLWRGVAEGRVELGWDGRDHAGRAVAAGVYHFRLTAAGGSWARRLVLTR